MGVVEVEGWSCWECGAVWTPVVVGCWEKTTFGFDDECGHDLHASKVRV